MDALGIMLDAGRVVQADKNVVIDSLAKEGSTELTFLDFVAYLPLFVNIHDDIRRNTLTQTRRSLMPDT